MSTLSCTIPPPSPDLCVPMNTAPFVMTVSRELAQKEPHLTLEFLTEVVAVFQQYSPALKQFCLAYLSPWLPNLSLSLFEATATEHEKASVCMHFENVYAHIEYLHETGIVGTCTCTYMYAMCIHTCTC